MNKELRTLSALNCRPGAPMLLVSELMLRLHALPGWDYAEQPDLQDFRFANYYETIAFVNAIAYMANRQDHHPDLSVHYNRVVVSSCDARRRRRDPQRLHLRGQGRGAERVRPTESSQLSSDI